MRILTWAIELLILASGIYLFLRFVRITRGSRLVRGLLLLVVFGVLGLWGLARVLELEELAHLLRGATGFLVVIFAILFQPELRRGLVQLGEQSLLRRLMRRSSTDVVSEVVRAASRLAERRHGALLAFEREASLEKFVETGVPLDARTGQLLVESLFQPASPLHDGALVLRGTKIAAAGCLFPLTDNDEISKSVGTRHRAALGLTDETDAVCVLVSEETGRKSLAVGGRLRQGLSDNDLDTALRELLGLDTPTRSARQRRTAVLQVLRRDLVWIGASLLLGGGILYFAHRDIRQVDAYSVRLVPAYAGAPGDREIAVALGDEALRMLTPERRDHTLLVSGSRAQLEELEGGPAGVLELGDVAPGDVPLRLGQVRWRDPVLGLGYEWEGEPPVVRVARFGSRSVSLTPEHLAVVADELDPRFEVRRDAVRFEPSAQAVLHGPEEHLARLGGDLQLAFEPIALAAEEASDRREPLRLAPALRRLGLELRDEVVAHLPVVPVAREAGLVQKDVALISLDPARTAELARWRLPDHAQTARFRVLTSGLVPATADPESPAALERTARIRGFVEDALVVWADVAELPVDGRSRAVPLRYTLREDWRESPEALGLAAGTLSGREELELELEGPDEVFLEPRGE